MRKVIDNGGYFIALTTANVGLEITEAEHDTIMQKIQSKPVDPTGYQYKLTDNNLEWELVELPEPEPKEEDAEISDYEDSLSDLGVRFGD